MVCIDGYVLHCSFDTWPYHRSRFCRRKVVIGSMLASLQMSSFFLWSFFVLPLAYFQKIDSYSNKLFVLLKLKEEVAKNFYHLVSHLNTVTLAEKMCLNGKVFTQHVASCQCVALIAIDISPTFLALVNAFTFYQIA